MKHFKEEDLTIKGAGGGGGSKQHTPVEQPNTLRAKVRGRILDLIAYGPIKGLVNGLQSVYLDDTPVENPDGSSNFSGITVTTRNGTPDQDHIPGFRAVENTAEINAEVKFATPVIRSVTNNDADAVAVTIQLASLVKQEENGDAVAYSVPVAIDVRKDGGAWQPAFNYTIEGKTTSPYPKTFRIDLKQRFGAGSFDIRVRRGNEESADSKIQDKMTWTLLTEIIDRRFSHPNMALVGIDIDSELFGSQMPARSYDMYLSITKVPSNWDPETRVYTGLWDGSFKEAYHDNPAWAYYDLATHPVIGAGLESVDKWELYRIAQYCDGLVPNGYGAMEPRFTINTVFSSQEDATAALDTLASIFRGMTYWGNNTVIPVADMPEDPVLTVGPSSVLEGDFSYVGTSIRERHSVAVVMWNDPEDAGKAVPEVYEDPVSIAEFGWRETRVTAVGCNSRGQARRMGMWILDSERHETQTMSYTGTSEHAFLRPGNIIEVADPFVQGARMSGRLLEVATNQVRLDKAPSEALSQVGGTWYLSVMLPDLTLSRHRVSNVSGDVIYLLDSLTTLPLVGAIWGLYSAGLQLPYYRVVSNREDSATGMYQITATEYDPNKYSRVELGLNIPERPISLIPTGMLPSPMNLEFKVYTYFAGSSRHQGLLISWEPPSDVRVESFVLDVKDPSQAGFRTVYTGPGTSFDLLDAEAGNWTIRVRSVSSGGNKLSNWTSRTVQISQLLLPSPPDSVTVTAATLSITLTPVSAYPEALWEFWRSPVALTVPQIEANALQLPTGSYLVDSPLKPDTLYFYYVRGTNQYGKSTWVGVQGTTLNDFDDILEAVLEDIKAGPLYQELQEQISTTGGAIVEAVREQLDTEIATVQSNLTAVQDQLTTDLTAVDNQLDDLALQVGNTNDQVAIQLGDLNVALSGVNTEIAGINGELDGIRAEVDGITDALVYDPLLAYAEDEVTRVGKRLYQAIQAVPAGNSPPNATYWVDIGQVIGDAAGNASAITQLTTRMTNVEGVVTAQAGSITSLNSALAGKADASALTALTTRVTSAEGVNTSQGSSITQLTTNLADSGSQNLLYNPTFTKPGSVAGLADGWATNQPVTPGASTGVYSLVPSWINSTENSQRIDVTGLNDTNLYRSVIPSSTSMRPSVQAGTSVALSVYFRATAGLQVRLYMEANNAAGGVVSVPSTSLIVATGGTQRATLLFPNLPATTVRVTPFLRVFGGTVTAGFVEFTRAQIEVGSAVTGWRDSALALAADQAATSTALSALTSTVTQQGTTLTSQGTSITSLNNSLTTTNGNVATAQAAADAANTLAGGKGKVLVQTSTPAAGDQLAQNLWIDITGGANTPKRWTGSEWAAVTDKVATDAAAAASSALTQVALKADSTTVSALSNTVTQQGTSITAQGTSITSIAASLGDVGGQNLLYNSSFEKVDAGTPGMSDGWWYDGSAGSRTISRVPSTLTPGGLAQRIDATGMTAAVWARLYVKTAQRTKVVTGTTYTYSVYVKATAGLRIKSTVYGVKADGSASTNWNASSAAEVGADGAWQRLTTTFTADALTDNVYVSVVAYGTATISVGFFEVDNAQLQVGNTASGWKDNNGTLTSDVSALADATTSLTGRVTTVEGTVTSQGSSITSLANSITETGSQNLLYNPAFTKTGSVAGVADGWDMNPPSSPGASTGVYSLVPSWINAAESSQRIDVTGINESNLYRSIAASLTTRPEVQGGATVALSVYFRATAGLQVRLYLQAVDTGGNVLSGPSSGLTVATGGTQRATLVSANLPAGTVRVVPFLRVFAGGAVTAGYVEFTRAQLETGATVSGWRDSTLTLAADQAATSAALSSLTSTVTSQGTTLTSQSASITSLNNTFTRTGENSPTKIYQSLFSGLAMDQWRATLATTATISNSNVAGNLSGATLTIDCGTGKHWWGASSSLIRFDPTRLYKMTARVQQVSTVAGNTQTFLGLDGYAEDGVTRISTLGTNVSSNAHYTLMSSRVLDVGVWTDVTCYVKGFTIGGESGNSGAGTLADPRRMKTGIAWISPMGIFGYNSLGGVVALDYLWIEDVTEQAQIDVTSAALTTLTSTVTTQGTAITSQGASITSLTNNIGSVGGENLHYNPSFEKAGTTAGLAEGWVLGQAPGVVSTPTLVASGIDPAGKAQRLDMTGLHATNYADLGPLVVNRPSVSPGQTLTMSTYVRATAGLSVRLYFQWKDSAGATIATDGPSAFTADGNWQRVSKTTSAVAPAGTVAVHLLYRILGTAVITSGFVEWDRAQVELSPVMTGWSDNGKQAAADQAATSNALSALTSTVTQQGTTLTSQSGSITNLTNSINAIGGAGINLLPAEYTTFGATAPAVAAQANVGIITVANTAAPSGYMLKVETLTALGGYFFLGNTFSDQNVMVKPNAKYILSFWAYGSAAHTVGIRVKYNNAAGTSVETEVASQAVTTTLTRYSVVLTMPATVVDRTEILIYSQRTAAIGITYFDGIMVEAQVGGGTSPSDFVPGYSTRQQAATSAALSSLTSTVTNQGSTITSQGTAITNLTNTINDVNNGLNSKASAAALTSLTDRVTAAEGTITSTSAAVTSLQNSLNSIGGDNMLPNSSFETLATGSTTRPLNWMVSGSAPGTLSLVDSPLPSSTKALRMSRLAATNGQTSEIMFNQPEAARPKVTPGQTYTLSVWARGSDPNVKLAIYLQFYNAANTAVLHTPTLPETALTTTFTRYTISGVAPAGAGFANVYAGRIFNRSGGTMDMWAELDNVQLQEGSVATAYTPSNERNTEALSTALSALTSTVTTQGGTITSQGASITTLTNTVNDANSGLSTKASAAALTSLTNRVAATEGSLTSQSSSITQLTNTLASSLDNSPTKVYQSIFSALSADQWVQSVANTSTATFSNVAGNTSGATLTFNGGTPAKHWWGSSTRRIRFDPARLYKLTARVQQVSYPGLVPSFYAGLDCYAEDGATRINSVGDNTVNSAHYVLAGGTNPTLGTWVTYTAYVKGFTIGGENGGSGAGTVADPRRLKTGTAWFCPMIISGHDNRGGVLAVDYFTIEDATDQAQIDTTSTALTGLTSRVTTAEGSITSQSSQLTTLNASIGTINDKLGNAGIDAAANTLWNFDAGLNGWTSNGTVAWQSNGAMRVTHSVADTYILSSSPLALKGSQYYILRARITRVAGAASDWDGTVYYSTTGHTFDIAYSKKAPNPNIAVGQSATVEWDMSSLTQGGTDWLTASSIAQIRIDIGATAGAAFDVDFIVAGRVGPGASSQAVTNLQANVSNVNGIVSSHTSQITTLNAAVGNNSASISTQATAIADAAGKLSSSYTVKMGITTDGRYFTAGFGIGLSNATGAVQSQFIVNADQFAVLNGSADLNNGGTVTSPFLISGGIVYIQDAFIRSASITNAKIADGAITNAKIANASITTAKIGVAEVDTLRIRGNAVTVPTSSTNPSTGTGSGVGSWIPLVAVGVSMDEGGFIMAQFGCYQSFGSGIRKYMFEMDINGIVIAQGGGDWADGFPTLISSIGVGPGYFVITVKWWGENTGVSVSNMTLYAMGTKR